MFRAKHSGVSNPSLGLSYGVSAIVGLLSSFIFVGCSKDYVLNKKMDLIKRSISFFRSPLAFVISEEPKLFEQTNSAQLEVTCAPVVF